MASDEKKVIMPVLTDKDVKEYADIIDDDVEDILDEFDDKD